MLTTQYTDILAQIQKIDPIAYGKSRNFLNGKVTQLSPYISRGVISTKQIVISLLNRGFTFEQCERFFQQLSWREYFQRVAQHQNKLHKQWVKFPQSNAKFKDIPSAVLNHQTGITAIDQSIHNLYDNGMMHNHTRMYVSSVVCNIAKTAWQLPSKWMYYHLLDADYASNFLSWQWVCGSFSSKLYVANQENINKYSGSNDKQTFLDVEYETFENMPIPEILNHRTSITLETKLPTNQPLKIIENSPIYVYNYYNLDPIWNQSGNQNNVLLIEPSHFSEFPISQNNFDFMLKLAQNIPNVQVFVGEFHELKQTVGQHHSFVYKEHPLFAHYEGQKHEREWVFPEVSNQYGSFFKFWQACMKNKKHLNKIHQ